MTGRIFGFVCLLLAVFLPAGSEAQQSQKALRIGFLFGLSPAANASRVEAFRQRLRELGYIEGKDVVIQYRAADGKAERLPNLANELVRLNVDVIVTAGPSPTRAVKEATSRIPIVMAWDSDPVGDHFVSSLARPGGNITGLSTLSPELSGKQLELLKETIPRLSRVLVLWTSNEPGYSQILKQTESAAEALKVRLQSVDVRVPNDIETAIGNASKSHVDGIFLVSSRVFFSQRKKVVDLAGKSRIPAIYNQVEYVDAGGLMSYATSFTDLYRRAAIYVDKILKGAKPAELPVEQPTKFEFVINLKAAKQIGLTIPPNVLARADRVIR